MALSLSASQLKLDKRRKRDQNIHGQSQSMLFPTIANQKREKEKGTSLSVLINKKMSLGVQIYGTIG